MNNQPTQDLEVYQRGGAVEVRGRINMTVLAAEPDAATAIQAAIDLLADDGGEILIHRGDYTLKTPLRLADKVSLRGRGRGSRFIVEADSAIRGDAIQGAWVSDLALTTRSNASHGIVLDACGDCQISNVFAVNFSEAGIRVCNNAFLNTIRDCTLANNGKAGILLQDLAVGRAGSYLPNVVSGCIIFGGGKGIETDQAIVVNIANCVIHQPKDTALHIGNDSNSVAISGCRTFQTSGHAVVVENSHEFSLTSSVLCWQTGHGIVIEGSRWGTIVGNQIIDSGSYNSGLKNWSQTRADLPENLEQFCGVRLVDSRGYTIANNAIFNWQFSTPLKVGVYEDNRCFKNNINHNTINFFTEAAVVSDGADSLVEHNLSQASPPYHGEPTPETGLQSFDPAQTEAFIKLIE